MSADRHESEMDTLAEEWARRLHACQYAGELVVDEDDLPKLAKTVRRDLFSLRRSKHTDTCMFVLAVNCMYYHHDEEGFWAHFCPLIGISDQACLGGIIESKLLEFHFLENPLHGPYKNVTPLRDQCGITRSEIPRFADLLKWMSEHYGWDGIRILDPDRLSGIVSVRNTSGHLAGFLKTAQGHSFVRDVARNVSQFQRRILSMEQLTTLTGYRSGFFDELFDALGRLPPPTPLVTRPPLPRLLFFQEFRQVGLSFDPGAVMKGAFRIEGEVVRQTPHLWQSPDEYSHSITGRRRDSDGEWSNWSIPGWDPSFCPVALFHVDRGFVDHRASVPPAGEYFMLGPYANPPPPEVCVGDYGMVDLPFPDLELDAWRIDITATTDLTFLGLERPAELDSIDLIAWHDSHSRISGTLESSMAFTGSLPPISIRRPELFTSNAVALFIDDGKETRRIHVAPRSSYVRLDVAAPSQGRVWVEPISRLREFAGRDTLCELHYYLLPECNIQWPQSLYSLDEQPEITLSTRKASLSLELENATPVDSEKRHWRAAAGTTVLQGHLRTTQFSVPIAKKIYRATLREQNKQLATYMLSRQIQKADAWILAGMPHESADLAILDGAKTLLLGTLGAFNAAGECRFPGTAIRDAIFAHWKKPVGCFAVSHAGRPVRTSTLYVDCPAITQWISNAVENDSPTWLSILNNPLRSFFETALSIRERPQRIVHLPDLISDLPEELQAFFTTLRSCSAIFDDSLLPDKPEMLPEQVAEVHSTVCKPAAALLVWYLKANAFVRDDESARGVTGEDLLEEYKNTHWTPPFLRWRKAIEEALAHIKDDVDLIPLVQEWKHDVHAGFRSTYPSRIAKQNGGRKLTEAWIRYSHYGDYQSAINVVTHLMPQTGSPVADLAAILLVLCCLRKGLFESQPALQHVSTNRKLSAVFDEIKALAKMGTLTRISSRPSLTQLSKILPSLPLRQEDVTMIAAVSGDADNNSHDSDWLTCYYCALLFESGIIRKDYPYPNGEAGILERVPASPEKPRIVDTLERYLHD